MFYNVFLFSSNSLVFSSIPWVSKDLKTFTGAFLRIPQSAKLNSAKLQNRHCLELLSLLISWDLLFLLIFRLDFAPAEWFQSNRRPSFSDCGAVWAVWAVCEILQSFEILCILCLYSFFIFLCQPWRLQSSQGILRAQELQRLQWIDDATDALQVETLKPQKPFGDRRWQTSDVSEKCRVVFLCPFLSNFYTKFATAQSTHFSKS